MCRIKENEFRFSNLKSAYETMKYQHHPDYIYNVEYNKNDGGYFLKIDTSNGNQLILSKEKIKMNWDSSIFYSNNKFRKCKYRYN